MHEGHVRYGLAIRRQAEVADAICDEVEIDYKAGLIKNKTAGTRIKFAPLPDFALEIINAGGLLEHIKNGTTDLHGLLKE